METEYRGKYKHPDPPRQSAWCFYCGKPQPWFFCECAEALEARSGKRGKPRWQRIDGKNVMILEPDLLTRPWNAQRLPVHKTEPVHVHNSVDTADIVDTEAVDKPKADRRDYFREQKRKQRARAKDV